MRSFPTPAITRRKRQIANRKSFIFLTLTLLAIWGCGPAASNPVVVFCSPDSPRMQQAIAALRENLPEVPPKVVCSRNWRRNSRQACAESNNSNPGCWWSWAPRL